MQWEFIVALVIVIPIALFPLVFIWYLNIGGIYAAIKERKFKAFEVIIRRTRIALAITVPVGLYAFLVWFFFSSFGWQVALAVALVLPIVLFVPALVWAAVASGLYQVAREALRRRATAPRRRATRLAEEPVPGKFA